MTATTVTPTARTAADIAAELLKLRTLEEHIKARSANLRAILKADMTRAADAQGTAVSYPTDDGTLSLVGWAKSPSASISDPTAYIDYLGTGDQLLDPEGRERATATIGVPASRLAEVLSTLTTWGDITPTSVALELTDIGRAHAEATLTVVEVEDPDWGAVAVVLDRDTGETRIPGTTASLPSPTVRVTMGRGILAQIKKAAADAAQIDESYQLVVARPAPALPAQAPGDPF